MVATQIITLTLTAEQRNTVRQALLTRSAELRRVARNADLRGDVSEASRLNASAQDTAAIAARFK